MYNLHFDIKLKDVYVFLLMEVNFNQQIIVIIL
jgi:hypothetical protein